MERVEKRTKRKTKKFIVSMNHNDTPKTFKMLVARIIDPRKYMYIQGGPKVGGQ